MRKIRALATHVFFVLFPALFLLGLYGIFILYSAWTDSLDASSVKALAVGASIEGQTPSCDETMGNASVFGCGADPFAQTEVFTDADVQDSISIYEATLPGIAQRYGAKVQVEELASVASQSAEKVSVVTSESTFEADPGAKSDLIPPPVWNLATADIWRVETAYASRMNPNSEQLRKVIFYRWVDSHWEKQETSAFLETLAPSQPLIFYVHGNRTELSTATMQGVQALKNFPTAVPARLVLWCWDSDRVSCRPKIEYSTKARYADFQGFYLADFLGTLEPEQHVVLVGHSFGARTILCSLHLLAGGTYGTRTLEGTFAREERSVPVLDVLLVAPAVGCNALDSNAIFARALASVSHLNLTQNESDPALRFYPRMNGAKNRLPEALGYVGPVLNHVEDAAREKVRVIRLDYPTHQFMEYLSMRSVQNGLQF